MKHYLLAITLIVISLAVDSPAATYYVSNSGTDSNDGTDETAAWETLQHAADTVQAGDTVIVLPGTYQGFLMEAKSGTAEKPITFSARTGAVINDDNPAPHSDDGIYLFDCDYVVIEGFEIQGGDGTNIARDGIRVVGTAADPIKNVTIRNNKVDACGNRGIFSGFADDILIEANQTSRSVAEHGIYVSNSGDRPVVRENTSWGNNASGIQLNADLSAGGDGIITNALIEENVIYENGAAGGAAINLDGVQSSTIQNNLLHGNHATGIALFRSDGAEGSKNNTLVNNTVVMADDSRWALSILDQSSGNTVYNNILYTYYPSFRGSMVVSQDSLDGLFSDYNAVMDRFSNDGGSTSITLSQWQTLTGLDISSFVADPDELFVDPAQNDYQLFTTSLALDTGTNMLAPATDIIGTPRPAREGFDIGAYELPIPEPSTITTLVVTLGAAMLRWL